MKNILLPLICMIYMSFLAGCQSVSNQKGYAPKNTPTQSSSTSAQHKDVKPSPNQTQKVETDNVDADPEAYTPAFFEQNDYDDENTFSDAQNFLNADEDLPNEEDASPANICEDSIYYNSWKRQFDATWLAEHSKFYKSSKKREAALQKARADAYLQFAYPTVHKTSYDFPAVVNLQVASWIEYFTGKGRKNFVVWLRRGQELIPKLEDILDKNGLPKDLVYLAMIESGFNNRAVSIDGAVGTWQFMPYTGRQYGLVINDWVDERRDPIKATHAAARYLTDLYTKFGSWHLAAGAYNCGEGCIARKLQKYGEDSSYFDLTSQGVINSQTANYVPKILAAMIIAKNPEKFGFETNSNQNSFIQTETMVVNRSISLADLAVNIGMDAKVLGDLNPALRLGITPPTNALKDKSFQIIVPTSKYELATNILEELPDASQQRMVQARIQKRESLQKFASRYHLDIKLLQQSNSGLRKTTLLKKGQYVNVPVTLGTGQYEKLFAINKHKNKKSKKRFAKGKKLKYTKKYAKRSHNTKSKIVHKKTVPHTNSVKREAKK